jgi:PBP1b-binding outer membrane lipoprotein LpoB
MCVLIFSLKMKRLIVILISSLMITGCDNPAKQKQDEIFERFNKINDSLKEVHQEYETMREKNKGRDDSMRVMLIKARFEMGKDEAAIIKEMKEIGYDDSTITSYIQKAKTIK